MKKSEDKVIDNLVEELQNELQNQGIDPRNGLPESLFLLLSSLTPIPNIDLFVTDSSGRFLLSWRDDKIYGSGWHIPGGCIRMLETMEHRIQMTAENELGTGVICNNIPVLTIESIKDDDVNAGSRVRAHHICILFKCELPEGYSIEEYNKGKKENESGYLKWFDEVPDDFLPVQVPLYKKYIEKWLSDGCE
ncbi:NUDIX domain-containing protein [Butyrivibrio sp. WCD2001]|uniref:NUDIX domain-containing protein n=1 Tax=Butyrivibrio sp. WCD2001 TaxID=1280681 RepID=UPI00041DB2B7|nr:NUDIX hydrolase [Butyrivibrio sp. WCD2001]